MNRCIVSLFVLLSATYPYTRSRQHSLYSPLIANGSMTAEYDRMILSNFRSAASMISLRPLEMGKRRRGRYDAGRSAPASYDSLQCAIGTPRRNAAVDITNAIVITSYYSVISHDMYSSGSRVPPPWQWRTCHWPMQPIDTICYYVVHGRPLGTWGASIAVRRLRRQLSAVQLTTTCAGNYRMWRAPSQARAFGLVPACRMVARQTYVWASCIRISSAR